MNSYLVSSTGYHHWPTALTELPSHENVNEAGVEPFGRVGWADRSNEDAHHPKAQNKVADQKGPEDSPANRQT